MEKMDKACEAATLKECTKEEIYNWTLFFMKKHADALEQQARLREVILWLLGEKGEFPDRPEKVEGKIQPLYWWRTELRKRFEALQATPSGDAFDARAAVVELAEMVIVRKGRIHPGHYQRAVELKRKAQG